MPIDPEREISEAEFAPSRHRQVPARFRERYRPRFWRLPLAQGNSTAVEFRVPATVGESRGQVLVLHGLGDDSTYPLWSWLAAFADQGLTTVSLDWDGHGVASQSLLDYSTLGESVEAAIAALSKEPVSIVGHSTGALAAALHREARLRHPGNLALPIVPSYLLVSPALGLAPVSGRIRELTHLKNREFLTQFLPAAVGIYGFREAWPAIGQFRRAEFPVRLRYPARGSAAEQLADFTRSWKAGKNLTISDETPCTVYFGERDSIIDIEAARRQLAGLFRKVNFQSVAGQGHWGMAFSNHLPEKLARTLRKAMR